MPPLAEWVADRLDDLAGVPRPDGQAGQARYALTFGELWLGRLGTRSAEDLELLRRAARDPQERVVDLVLAAADVSQGRPHRLPFPAPGRRGAGTSTGTGTGSAWLFCHDCLAGVLPARVVEQMVLTSPAQVPEATCPRHSEQTLQQVPDPWDFPVVAAVRMAVSTPGLLSAVPLHALEPDGPPGGTRAGDPAAGRGARIHWFCDGGLTGTLGVDAFDALLPRWPTFAVTLDSAPGPALSLPEQDSGPQRRPWRAVDTAGSFVLALLGTAAGWRDRVQAELPGLRGRVAQVQAGPRAGSLFPDQATILDLAVRGHQAGTALRERFTGPDGELSRQTQTDRYRWIRLRAALRELRGLSVDLGARLPLYSDLATGYRVPAALHAWFDPPLAPGAVDRSWPDAAAAVTHVRALSAGGVLDWDTDDGAPPAERDLTPGPPP